MRRRLGARSRGEVLSAEYRKPFGLSDLTLELFPAGHVLGSAQLRVTRRGIALGYSGDLCLEPSLTAERAEVVECDVLVLESTYGLPRYVFPPKEQVLAQVRRFVDDALAEGATPVLLGYALGKAQEILKYLGEAGYRCRAHRLVHAINSVYLAQGVRLPNVELLGPEGPGMGEVVVAPPTMASTSCILRIANRRTAVLSGWALDGWRGFRGASAAFPLSDHADFPSLVRYAKATGADRVLTVHGYTHELASALKREGIRAEPLVEREQLELL